MTKDDLNESAATESTPLPPPVIVQRMESNYSDSEEDSNARSNIRNKNDGGTGEEEEIGVRNESEALSKLRMFAFIFLFFATAGVALCVFFYVRINENNTFTQHYEANAYKVLETVGSVLDQSLGAVDSFAVSIISYARTTAAANTTTGKERSWPYVTIPDYAVRASKLRSLSKAFLFTNYHIVKGEQREEWEEYTRTHLSWIDEGIEVQKLDPTFRGAIVEDWYSLGYINFEGQRAKEADLYLPRWQSSPIVPRFDPVNWNPLDLSFLKPALDEVMKTKQVVVSTAYNLWDLEDPIQAQMAEETAAGLVDLIGPDDDPTEPASEFYYPLLDAPVGQVSTVSNEAPVVGVLALSIFWRDLIRDILPPGTNGMIIVLENTCEQSFTYRLDGPNTVYLGNGDRHDMKYNNLKKSSPIMDLGNLSIHDRSYTGASISIGYCPYTMHIYPSSTMEARYLTPKPLLYMCWAILIFAFMSFIFVLYDVIVIRRHRKVMYTAIRSTAIVSSLFPSNVRDRLFENNNNNNNDDNRAQGTTEGSSSNSNNNHLLQSFLVSSSTNEKSVTAVEPICDFFDETTVFFADIKGFTSWSAKRQPSDVFLLLETLYSAYDEVAEKRGVFKVETIGDSYVAACGLPEPRKDHACVLCRFANDVRIITRTVTQELAESLGSDTADLCMRIGLHSGPTTAGVLRGQRARFQLFGDTVNTASRMESNGLGDKIQVSQATADLLIAGNKGHWLTKREELVHAKGKGSMQTYWVEPTRSRQA